jgi:predicted metal-dependent hydrolase
VQFRLPFPAASAPFVEVGGRRIDVAIVRHRRARRYLLRVAPDGTLRLTVPRGAPIADGLKFVSQQGAWIERERLRQHQRAAPWRVGTTVRLRGVEERLAWDGLDLACGAERLRVERTAADFRPAVERHLRALASRELPARCLALAAHHRLAVSRVVVRNQRSRWGSCSPSRVIALNWRLIQMPDAVSEYVILHELMHLRQPNHSRRFWREVAAVCPAWRDSERWLRKHGRELL